MKTIVPDYYSSFACLMSKCRHTCCAGWEIDIDEDTLRYYRTLSGDIGKKLSRCIDETGETVCFRLTADERCPFLTQNGLCELILTLGENSLCQICDDHPRFRNFFSDRTEMGLGLCCEAAARLILTHDAPVHLTVLDDDGIEDTPDEAETALLALRDQMIGMMQNRSLPVAARVQQLPGALSAPVDFAAWAELLLSLERLDEAWTHRLNALLASADEAIDDAALTAPEWEVAFEQLMVYLLYRHAGTDDIGNDMRYCAAIWTLLRRMFLLSDAQSMEQLVELARLYSSEIEYSDENLAAIRAALYEF